MTTAIEHSPPRSEIAFTIYGNEYATAALPNNKIEVITKCFPYGVGYCIFIKEQI